MEKLTVALAGATGALGRLIAGALLDDPQVSLRCLVRAESRIKVVDLERRGAQVVEGGLGPGSRPTLDALCTGAYSVVSAVQGGPEIIVDGQLRLLQAAVAGGVRRFIPSDFSLDLFNLADGENVMSDQRRRFAAAADAQRGGTELVHLLNGCFLDRGVLFGFLGAFDLAAGAANLWGDGRQPMDFTTFADTARYAAAAAVDPAPLPARFNVAGDVLDFHGLVHAYERGSGRKITVRRLGTLDDLDRRIAQLVRTDPSDVFAYLPLMYWRAMLNGKGKLGPLANDRYLQIRPVTVEQYVRAERL